jgi:flagellin-like protein
VEERGKLADHNGEHQLAQDTRELENELFIMYVDSKFIQVKYRVVRFPNKSKVKGLTRKIRKSRKAISPILATLLLVVIAVAAIVVTYAWIMTYMNNAGRQAGVMLYKANVNFYEHNSTLMIDIDVGNSGTSDTQLTTLYVGASTTSLLNQTITPVPLAGGKVARITIGYPWEKGVTYYFKVLSSTGQTFDWPETASLT